LQTALHDKAKGSSSFRFYALYDKVYRKDVLAFAYECGKANKGAAGVDGQTFEGIEEYGVERWLEELAGRTGGRTGGRTYRPLPVRLHINGPVSSPGGLPIASSSTPTFSALRDVPLPLHFLWSE
jgi:hypothetical protein